VDNYKARCPSCKKASIDLTDEMVDVSWEMSDDPAFDALYNERNEIERQAIEWAERWKAKVCEIKGYKPDFAISLVQPISFGA
jgi:hypothetical protein